MRLLPALLILVAAPLAAQGVPALAPHPAAVLWERPTATILQDTTRHASTGAGTATYVGAAVGALGGYMLMSGFCSIGDGPCGTPGLLGFALGGLVGAMVGSALEGGHPPRAGAP